MLYGRRMILDRNIQPLHYLPKRKICTTLKTSLAMDKKITTEVSKLQALRSKISPIIYEICAEIGHISKLLGKKEYIDRCINKKQMIQNQINQKKHEMENLKQQEKNNDDILDYSPYQSGYKSLKPRSKTHGKRTNPYTRSF